MEWLASASVVESDLEPLARRNWCRHRRLWVYSVNDEGLMHRGAAKRSLMVSEVFDNWTLVERAISAAAQPRLH